MPSVHFRDHAVFGGGGSDEVTAGVQQPAPQVFKSSKPELSGQEYASQELLNQAEAVVDKDNASISAYKSAIGQALSATNIEGTDEIGGLQRKLQAVQGVARPAVTYNSEQITNAFNEQVRTLNTKMQSAQQVGQTEIDAGTRNLVKKAIVDPTTLTTTAEVAELDPNTAGATLSQQTGQLSSDVVATPTAEVAPTATAAGVAPITTATATTGATQPAVTTATQATTAAQGQLTPQSILQGQQGTLSPEAIAEKLQVSDEYIKEVQAGTRIVSPEEIAKAAQAFNIPEAQAAQMLKSYTDVEAAKFDSTTPQAEAQDQYNLPF